MTEGLKGRQVRVLLQRVGNVEGFVVAAEGNLILIAKKVKADRTGEFESGDILISLSSGAFVELEVL